MDIRELKRDEWPAFFSAFSRHYRGQPVTVGLASGHPPQVIAKNLPLVAITAEHHGDAIPAIKIMVGDFPFGPFTHVAGEPVRVRIAQVTGGVDELLLIDTGAGPTTYIDFSPLGIDPLPPPDTLATQSIDRI